MLGYSGWTSRRSCASASIIGVAVGFGAQNLVKDFLSGIFMLLEDQYGVGDVIDVGAATGTVEAVTLRITRLRDINGVVWYVRNGEIKRVGNESQNWARVVLDVPWRTTPTSTWSATLLAETAGEMAADPPWDELIIEEPAVWGVQALSGERDRRTGRRARPRRAKQADRSPGSCANGSRRRSTSRGHSASLTFKQDTTAA